MLNKNVCPNCGQLYDPELAKCPLCGTAPQVVETADPVQRKRITEAERKQRRSERKEAEQEARRRRRDARFMADAEEERRIEEEDARRKEEKRRLKEEKKAARRAAAEELSKAEPAAQPEAPLPFGTPAPARDGRKPMPEPPVYRDRRRVPRVLLALSALVLLLTLVVGGSYLLWKLDAVKLPIYDKLAAQKNQPAENPTEPIRTDPAGTEAFSRPTLPEGEGVACRAVILGETKLSFEERDSQTQLLVTLEPEDTTDERVFTSSDTAVVKVSPVGIVTAVGPGTAVITVSCGTQKAECEVVCDFAEDPNEGQLPVDVESLTLVKDDMTFFAAGENYVLSVTNIPAGTPVEWKSLDESICTVDANGHVVAVGEGTTRVIATVGELSAECWVRCKFK